MKRADLHIHTTASDGLLSPKEVVRWANIKRLSAISITDHDTVGAIDQAIIAAMEYNIEVIPGIELNTEYEKEEIHILGYYIDYKAEWFLDKLKEIQNSRYLRAQKMIRKLNDMNINITIEDVEALAENRLVGRPHIARVMLEKGYIENMKDAFDNYIGMGKPAYEERYKLSCEEAIRIIIQLNGVPVLAHPGLINNMKIVEEIVDMGIRGIEVYHSKHDEETIRKMQQIAKARDLIVTGGSDCHGFFVNDMPILGNTGVDYNQVQKLKEEAFR